jgi:hypothetical protein
MLTGSDLLHRVEAAFPGEVARLFQFPFLRLQVTSTEFRGLDDDVREQLVAERANITVAELRAVCNRLFFRLDLRTGDEPAAAGKADRGHFWTRLLTEPAPQPEALDVPVPPVVHFYGYKGGQARSTVLCFLARVLANDGWRVLTIDVDAEAPSLDVLLGAPATGMASSLLGVRAGVAVTPVRAVTPAHGGGHVDLLPFRPQEERFDLDAAALALEGNIHPPSLTKIILAVAKLATGYDVVLVDHRTGLASTVPPWVRHLPGPVVAFARMDGQWRPAKSHLRRLWGLRPESPGVLLSFKPDNESTVEDYRRRLWEQAAEPLGELALAMVTPEMDPENAPTAEDVADHWVVWPYDTNFNEIGVPGPDRVGAPVRDAADTIRRLLDLTGKREIAPPALGPSGAVDEGDLIQTQALRALSAPNNPYIFIVGRKGTGKTRLLRTLVNQKLGEALLVSADDKGSTGVAASDVFLDALAKQTDSEPEEFWWTLLRIALERQDTERKAMSAALDAATRSSGESMRMARKAAEKTGSQRVFLIDGLETAFSAARTFRFIDALFRVEASLRSDPIFSDKVRLRIFIRTDLAERGYENFEQQAHDHKLSLVWDTQSILNFALSRIGRLPWFERNFPQAYRAIDEYREPILAGALPVIVCEMFLLEIFPRSLRRLNLNTTTFLRTYFSDDPTGEHSYYPRIYDDFLRIIAGEHERRKAFHGEDLVDGCVSDALVYFAHEEAAQEFLNQVRTELSNLVEMDRGTLARLIEAFEGTVTPFEVERRCDELAERAGIDKMAVRRALDRMKTLGIFEERPNYPGQWRAGRLFKTSLRMRYNRKRKSDDAAE